ncbi:MAG: SRPBCC domain-containing protein [Granulosicoccus sp.]
MSNDTLQKTIFLNASPDTVWEFLTDKDKLGLWFHPAQNNLQAGQDYALIATDTEGNVDKICWGKVLEMDAPNRLVMTFTVKPLGTNESTLIWSLESAHGGTRLSLEHSGLASAAGAGPLPLLMAIDEGWDKHFAKLRTVAVTAA